MRIFFFTFFLVLASISVQASSEMCRVVAVDDRAAITAECRGHREVLALSGIETTDRFAASELLRWTVGNGWVMVERHADGVQLYRSPDGMFVNRELVLRGYARAIAPGIEPAPTTQAVYLGEVNPGPRGAATKSTRSSAPRPATRSNAPRSTTPRRPTRRAGR